MVKQLLDVKGSLTKAPAKNATVSRVAMALRTAVSEKPGTQSQTGTRGSGTGTRGRGSGSGTQTAPGRYKGSIRKHMINVTRSHPVSVTEAEPRTESFSLPGRPQCHCHWQARIRALSVSVTEAEPRTESLSLPGRTQCHCHWQARIGH